MANRPGVIKREKAAVIIAEETKSLEEGGWEYDAYLERCVSGIGYGLTFWDEENDTTNSENPMIIRGLSGRGQRAIKRCWETNRDFYYIDSGYMQIDQKKRFHRVIKNNLQHIGPIIERPSDRLDFLEFDLKEMYTADDSNHQNILICPPSAKAMLFYDKDVDVWVKETISEIKKFTDRPIEIRLKPSRRDRVTHNTIQSALDKAYCLVTFNSIAATESLLHGVPAIALASNNSARMLCNTSISEIENLTKPSKDEIYAFACHLSYCQFTPQEMLSGLAMGIVDENIDIS